MDKAVVRMYFDDNSFKSFLILPKTTAADLVKQVQQKNNDNKPYYLYYTIGPGPEKCFGPNDTPWTQWQPNGDQIKLVFRTTPPKGFTPPAGGAGGGAAPRPGAPPPVAPRSGTIGGSPTPAGRSGAPQRGPTAAVSEDDFDSLLNQLTDIDVGGNKKGSGGGDAFDLDLNFGANLPTCSACGEVVKNNLMNAFGLQWHKEHLACAICRRNFLENDVPVVEGSDGNAYCEKDYVEKFAPRCGRCSAPVQGQCTNALGKQWHPQCFTCATCQKPFTGTFFEHQGQAYCEPHYYSEIGLVCPTCDRPIIGKCVKARGQRYHPQHFQCAHCAKKLTSEEYFFHNDKIYCKNCSIVFFG